MNEDLDSGDYAARFQAALAELDRAFAVVPPVGPVDGCGLCYAPRQLEMLGGDPDLVPDDLVGRFAAEVIDHWTQEQYGLLWRRFAPRIVRLAAEEEHAFFVGELLRGLGYAHTGFSRWPLRERSSVVNALSAALNVALVDGRRPHQVVRLLGGLAHIHDDVTPWLNQIVELPGPAASAGLVRLVCYWSCDVLWADQVSDWAWWYPADPVGIACGWLGSSRVRDRMQQFATEHPRCKTASDALHAIAAVNTEERLCPWLYPYWSDATINLDLLVTNE